MGLLIYIALKPIAFIPSKLGAVLEPCVTMSGTFISGVLNALCISESEKLISGSVYPKICRGVCRKLGGLTIKL